MDKQNNIYIEQRQQRCKDKRYARLDVEWELISKI